MVLGLHTVRNRCEWKGTRTCPWRPLSPPSCRFRSSSLPRVRRESAQSSNYCRHTIPQYFLDIRFCQFRLSFLPIDIKTAMSERVRRRDNNRSKVSPRPVADFYRTGRVKITGIGRSVRFSNAIITRCYEMLIGNRLRTPKPETARDPRMRKIFFLIS